MGKKMEVKRYLVFFVKNIVDKLLHELPNNLRLRVLGNYEILEKSQNFVQTEVSTLTPFLK